MMARRGMPRILLGGTHMGRDGRDAKRITTTLSRERKAELDRVARAHGVKSAWLTRRAVEHFLDEIAAGHPLSFGKGHNEER